ncbi:MAG TPA: CinA family nicotinamide mononucleotide deamidase-related protein [Candidatus Limnocylindria bacterium]|nr:CinA family nicotinamide mononucleotide deamidase-related protein [Candidatus Limnocylindria bacterium]
METGHNRPAPTPEEGLRAARERREDGTRRAEIICVGTELLLGDILNTNAQYLARGLAAVGLDHYIQTVVGDNEERMEQAIRDAMRRADILLFTGGLGPTGDDLTREVVARCFGRKLYMDGEALENIRAYYRLTKRDMPPSNEKQALQPEGAIKLDNPQGTAPGSILFSDEGHIAVLMPGPPREMRPMFDNLVAPYLKEFSGAVLISRQVRVIALGESKMAEMLADLMESSENPTLAPYAKDGEAMLRVTARAETEEEAKKLTEPVLEEVKKRLGRHAYGVDVENVETVVMDMLNKAGLRASFVEAGTAGLTAHRAQAAQGGEDAVGVCVSAATPQELGDLVGVRDVPEEPTPACEALARAAAGRLHTQAACAVAVRGTTHACAVLLDGRLETRTQTLPTRGPDYYRTAAAQACLDLLRNMLMDREEGKQG